MKTAVYELATKPTTFDFISWVVGVKTLGAERVHFKYDGKIQDWKYPKEIAWKRFGNILIPGCVIAGLPWELGPWGGKGFTTGYHYGQLEGMYRKLGRIEKLRPTMQSDSSGHVTITLRESFRNQHRNCNKEAWLKFAKYLEQKNEDVVVLQDAERLILDLEYRFALYAQAKQNMGASNGPFSLCHFSESPYLTFNMIPREDKNDLLEHMNRCNFGPGSQFSFRNKNQKLVWEPDDFETIVKHWNEWAVTSDAVGTAELR